MPAKRIRIGRIIFTFLIYALSCSVRIRTLLFPLFYANNICIAIWIYRKQFTEMIKYDKLWETMKARNITQYDLYTRYHMNRSQLNRLRHNQNVEVNTIDKLCNILNCNVEDIMTHYPDDNVFWTHHLMNRLPIHNECGACLFLQIK